MVKVQLVSCYSPSKSSSKGSVRLCQEEEKIFTSVRMVAGRGDISNPTKTERLIMAMFTERLTKRQYPFKKISRMFRRKTPYLRGFYPELRDIYFFGIRLVIPNSG